jgi:acyl carrier protein
MKDKFLKTFKETLEIEDYQINLDDSFREYDVWDSLHMMSLIAMLDEEFNVSMELDEFEQLITVGDLLNEVTKRATSNE